MDRTPHQRIKVYLCVLALLGWFALIVQFSLNIRSGAAPLSELVIRYFSYFTIITNLVVATCCTANLSGSKASLVKFFSKQTAIAAITVYILIVGIIYNLILRFLWKPVGLQRVVDEILHSVVPAMFMLYWLIFVGKDQLKLKHVFSWLLYPLIYITIILLRGAVSGFYPYPFINVDQLGLTKVLVNSFWITLAFLLLSLLLVGKGHYKRKPLS